MQIKPNFDKKAFERRLVDVFVQAHLNNIYQTDYEFVSRPDEKYPGGIPLPDFEYRDKQKNTTLIELGIITCSAKDITKCVTIRNHFTAICEELKGNVSGVFWLSMRYDRIQKKRTTKWQTHFARIKDALQANAKTMRADDKAIIEGVLLQKVADEGSSWHFKVINDSLLATSNITIAQLLEDAGKKFVHCNIPGSKNFLLLLHKGSEFIRDDISVPIKLLQSKQLGKEYSMLPMFSGLFEVYVLCLEPILEEFEERDITLCRCYPHLREVGLCSYSHIFKDIEEMHYILEHYIPGR